MSCDVRVGRCCVFALLLAVLTAACDTPTALDRDNPRDPANPDYMPAPPTGFTARADGAVAHLHWSQASEFTSGYLLLRSTNSIDFDTLTWLPSGTERFSDTLARPLVSATYRLKPYFLRDDSRVFDAPLEQDVVFLDPTALALDVRMVDERHLRLSWALRFPLPGIEISIQRLTDDGHYLDVDRLDLNDGKVIDEHGFRYGRYDYRAILSLEDDQVHVHEASYFFAVSAPVGLGLASATPAYPRITWSRTAHALGWVVERCRLPEETCVEFELPLFPSGNVPANYPIKYEDRDASVLHRYRYRVRSLGSTYSRSILIGHVTTLKSEALDIADGALHVAYDPVFDQYAVNSSGVIELIRSGTRRTLDSAGFFGLDLAFSGDGRLLVGRQSFDVVIFETESGARLRSFEIPGCGAISLALNADGSLLGLHCVFTGEMRVYDLHTEALLWSNAGVPGDLLAGITFSRCGRYVAASDQEHVYVWGQRSGERLLTLSDARYGSGRFAFSHDGEHFAYVDRDGAARLLQTRTWTTALELDHSGGMSLQFLAFSPDDSRLLGTGYLGGLWRLDTGGRLAWSLEPSHPHETGRLSWLIFARSGDYAVRYEHLSAMDIIRPAEPAWFVLD